MKYNADKTFYVARSRIHGSGLYTRKLIRKGKKFWHFDLPEMTSMGINHSCKPNVDNGHRNRYVRASDYCIRALRDILPREEITVKYKYGVANCNCPECRGCDE